MPDLRKKFKCKESKVFDRQGAYDKITPLGFREARRLHMPLYDALISELLEDGCSVAACHMQRLVDKEKMLYDSRQVLTLVSDEHDFLLELFESIKAAEQSCRLGEYNGIASALKLLYQTTFMVEKYDKHFPWLLEDYYGILASVVLHLKAQKLSSVQEYICRFSYKYGSYLAKTDKNTDTAIKVLVDAVELCKGEPWAPDTIGERYIYLTLHETIAVKLASVYLDSAKKVDLKNAMEMVDKALLYYAQVGLGRNKLHLARASCAKIELLIDKKNYLAAIKEIDNVQKHIQKETATCFEQIRCELYIHQGLCFYNQVLDTEAMKSFAAAYGIARKHNFERLEAELLLNIGKTRASSRQYHLKAFVAFVEAKRIFHAENDEQNRKKINYLLAKLKADQVFPELLSLLRSKNFCHFYKLRAWKNHCQPFWDVNLEKSLRALENRSTMTKAQIFELVLRDDADKQYFAKLGSEYAAYLFSKTDMEEQGDAKASTGDIETSSSFFREVPGQLSNQLLSIKDSSDSYDKYYEKMKSDAINCLVLEFGRNGQRKVAAHKEGDDY